MSMTPTEYLDQLYNESMYLVASNKVIDTNLNEEIKFNLNEILDKSESAKGVLTVIITSLVYKTFHPDQDIRNHQGSIENGYSGRTFDTRFVTPFLKKEKFPSMSESGWLTRSLEQKVPYDKNYPGAINPKQLKDAFLTIIDNIQQGENRRDLLLYLFQGLIIKRNAHVIDLAKPINLPIYKIIEILTQHFNSKYISDGASRLPVLALYAVYKNLISELKRFENKQLLPIESHTSSDMRSGRVGDIEIVDEANKTFEAVEIKHGIQITLQLVKDAFSKFSTTQVQRFYLLSTADVNLQEKEAITLEIDKIKNIHGCHVIVNGLIKTLNYYLRLLSDTSEFINEYVILLENDNALKYEHKKRWNEIISSQ